MQRIDPSIDPPSGSNQRLIRSAGNSRFGQHSPSFIDNLNFELPRNSGLPCFMQDDFSDEQQLGKNERGFVFKVKSEKYGELAVKKFRSHHIQEGQKEILRMISTSNHPNILDITGLLINDARTLAIGYTMEYMNNSSVCRAIYYTFTVISMRKKKTWISQAASALDFLHTNKISHLGVQPSNMLLKNNYNHLCLCDVGINRYHVGNTSMTANYSGSPAYTAPEIAHGNPGEIYEGSVDIYSLGIYTWEIITELAWSTNPVDRPSAKECSAFFKEKMSSIEEVEQEGLPNGVVSATPRNQETLSHHLRVVMLVKDVQTFVDSDFTGLEKIGSGGFGEVYMARHPRFGKVAVKVFNISWSFDDKREIIHMMRDSTHTNLVRFYGVLLKPGTQIPMGYVMELCDQTVKHALHKNKDPIYTHLKYNWICQIGRALDYLHSRDLVHRDIKPANMLLFNALQSLKICDLGMMRHSDGRDQFSGKLSGTPFYYAPEITLGTIEEYKLSLDIYSFAITIWEILTRREPFDHMIKGKSMYGLESLVAYKNVRPEKSGVLDDETWMLLEKSWDNEPSNRPTSKHILEHFEKKLEEEEDEKTGAVDGERHTV